jgi:uncharacterized protein (TIGR00299 family) protein
MILGACLDAGLEVDDLRQDLAGLGVGGYSLSVETVRKQGFAASQFGVRLDPAAERPHRHLKHIREIVNSSSLSAGVKQRAIDVFTRLAEAEAAAHGTTVEKVHFHEVGAIDAIVDIIGACIAMERMGIDRVYCSQIPTGNGTVQCEHGTMPVPAPATAALLKGVPLAECEEMAELTTPTGAAILTTLAERFGPMPGMAIERVGVGAGRRDNRTRPNILRLIIGEQVDGTGTQGDADEIAVLEANLDDISGEVVGYVYDRLFEAGALDVFTSPIYMKKNRPAAQLTVLAPPELRGELEMILFAETTTFGVRSHMARRRKLVRSIETVETELGPLRIKVGRLAGNVVTASPEYEDCREAAHRSGQPLADVMTLAMRRWYAGKE